LFGDFDLLGPAVDAFEDAIQVETFSDGAGILHMAPDFEEVIFISQEFSHVYAR
jgi:hypothetical protein